MEAMGVSMQGRVVQQRTLVIAVAVAAVLGIAMGLLLAPDSSATPERPESAADAGPREVSNGVPVGYARTEAGAVLAATNFGLASTNPTLIRDRGAYVRAIRTIAAPSWVEEAEERAETGHRFALDHYGPDVDMTTGVLRYEVLSFNRDEASVRLWTVTVAAGSNRPAAESVWGNSTILLEWNAPEGDWRMTGSDDEMGPVPVAAQPTEDGEAVTTLMEELSAFKEGPHP